ncbi:MAG: hypothetical protein C5B53_10920 [Candidatus Melainabacteria bacterium]|nr:MAG: hypothetical protein C5B53_10920 [Candidatus Melainabacteria bacterium]
MLVSKTLINRFRSSARPQRVSDASLRTAPGRAWLCFASYQPAIGCQALPLARLADAPLSTASRRAAPRFASHSTLIICCAGEI